MNLWTTVLVASALSFVLKLLGYLVPQRLVEGPVTSRIMQYLPVALLAALVAVQVFTGAHGRLEIDARAAGLGVAVLALLCRAPFIVVVVLAAATAAGLRALGIG